MTVRRLIVAAFMSVSVVVISASEADTTLIGAIESHKSPIKAVTSLAYETNPAAMYYRHETSLTGLVATGSYSHSDEAEVMQEGRGHTLGDIGVDTYMRMSDKSVVWGNASFTTGMVRDVKWSSAAEYDRLHPYVVGDSVGGNRTTRRYAFGGGYSGRSGRWTWGADVSYIAAIYYRDRDPRIKDVVSDLTIKLGATYSLSTQYALGVSGGLTVYNQDCDVEFYNPMNNIFEYALTGLGTTYVRFNGSENPAYEGFGYNAALQFVPKTGQGLNMTVAYDNYEINQILRDNNNLTLTSLASHNLRGEAGYLSKLGQMTVGVVADVSWQRRIGTEHLYGSGESNIYPEIGSRDQYYMDEVVAVLTLPIELRCAQHRITAMPRMEYVYTHEHYMRPSRDLEMQRLSPGVSMDYGCRVSEKLSVGATIGGAYGFSKSGNRVLTGLDPRSSIGEMVNHNFDMSVADRAELHCGISATRMIDAKMALSIEMAYDCRHYVAHGNTHAAMVSVGLKF